MKLKTLNGDVLEGWKRLFTNNGVPYYISCSLETSQWYHPEYVQLLQQTIQSSRNIKYTAYRTATKLAYFQHVLALDGISLQSMVGACASVGLSATECNDDHITVAVLSALLETLYGVKATDLFCTTNTPPPSSTSSEDTQLPTCKREYVKNHDSEIEDASNCNSPDKTVCIEMLVNLMLNLFDQSREGLLPVLGCKMVLCVLCDSLTPLPSRHKYLYTQLTDYNSAVNRSSVRGALQALARLAEVVGEELWFGRQLIEAALDSCFGTEGGTLHTVGVCEEEFKQWLSKEPQTLVWWSTLYRMSHASKVQHSGVECSKCKVGSPKGLLYVCLHCVAYTLCQDCFLSAQYSHPHEPAHPMQEYCTQVTLKDRGREVLSRLSERLKVKSCPSKTQQRYLPINSEQQERACLNDKQNTPHANVDGREDLRVEEQDCGALQSRMVSCIEEENPGYSSAPERPLPNPPKKKSLVNRLFKKKKAKKQSIKENLEMKERRLEEGVNDCPFKRFDRKTRSFGAHGSYQMFGGDSNSVRYGSCRMTKPLAKLPESPTKRVKSILKASNSNANESYLKVIEHNRCNSVRNKLQNKSESSSIGRSDYDFTESVTHYTNACSDSQSSTATKDSTMPRLEVKNKGIPKEGSTDSLPRLQLEKMIKQMQDDHGALNDLSVVAGSSKSSQVLQQHNHQLLQHIETLKQLLQTSNGPVGVVAPLRRPSTPPVTGPKMTGREGTRPNAYHQYHSTPLNSNAGGGPKHLLKQACLAAASSHPPPASLVPKGQAMALSPITGATKNDTAVYDNKQNHEVEYHPVTRDAVDSSLMPPPPSQFSSVFSSDDNTLLRPTQLITPPPLPPNDVTPVLAPRPPSFRQSGSVWEFTIDCPSAADRYSQECDAALSPSKEEGTFTVYECQDSLGSVSQSTAHDTSLDHQMKDILKQLDGLFSTDRRPKSKEYTGIECALHEIDDCLRELVSVASSSVDPQQ